MSWSSGISLLVGLAVAAFLVAANDPAEILRLLLQVGWGMAAIVALHLPQLLFAALGWAPLIDDPRRPGWPTLLRLRWIRQAANALLPVAQVAGEVARAQLLVRRGVRGAAATASVVVDLATEMVAQIAFAAAGLALLLLIPHQGGGAAGWLVGLTAAGAALAAGFMAAQRWGLFHVVEDLVARLAGPATGTAAAGLHDAVVGLYAAPRRLWLSGAAHLVSWALGTLEMWLALRLLGVEGAGLAEAMVIEGLSQTVRSLGFFIPGALGVQEGGFVLVCALFGIPPEQAIALALVRRLRDILLGVPGVVAWRWEVMAGRGAATVAARTLSR